VKNHFAQNEPIGYKIAVCLPLSHVQKDIIERREAKAESFPIDVILFFSFSFFSCFFWIRFFFITLQVFQYQRIYPQLVHSKVLLQRRKEILERVLVI